MAKLDDLVPGVARYGFDLDPDVIAYANEKWPHVARFAIAPAEHLPLPDGAVDLCVSRVALPYTDIPAALSEAARILIPGGRIWITLHPGSMVVGAIGRSLRRARVKDAIMQSAVLGNGLAFHIVGTSRRILGIRDSWQSESRMRRLLKANGFEQVRVTRGRFFLSEAVRHP